jgi:hypothetical protein
MAAVVPMAAVVQMAAVQNSLGPLTADYNFSICW